MISTAAIGIASAGEFKTDFAAAQAEAAESKKSMLVIFTGSDWCPPCKALHKNIFSKEEFVKGAEKDFVIVELDYPRKKEQTDALKKQNKKVGLQEGFLLPEGSPKILFVLPRKVWNQVR